MATIDRFSLYAGIHRHKYVAKLRVNSSMETRKRDGNLRFARVAIATSFRYLTNVYCGQIIVEWKILQF